jgi:hypothetical protein
LQLAQFEVGPVLGLTALLLHYVGVRFFQLIAGNITHINKLQMQFALLVE